MPSVKYGLNFVYYQSATAPTLPNPLEPLPVFFVAVVFPLPFVLAVFLVLFLGLLPFFVAILLAP